MNKLNLIAIASIVATVAGLSVLHIGNTYAQGNTSSTSAIGNASSGNITGGNTTTTSGGTTTSNVPSISSSSTSGY
jgi:hypothetical protein